jgi:predicted RNA-binding Zn ribbon-like protein
MTEQPAPAVVSGSKRPAPGDLELVRGFVNTVDVEAGTEKLDAPASLRDWMVSNGLISPKVTASSADLRKALDLRRALRSLLTHNDGEPLEPSAIEAVNNAAAGAKLVARLDHRASPVLDAEAAGVDAALGRLVAIVHRSMWDGDWDRLKICRSETCAWAFYDWSKNHSGAWCTMTICGNRSKVRSYRLRERSEARSSS